MIQAYRYLEEEKRKDKQMTNLEQTGHRTYRVIDGSHPPVLIAHMSMSFNKRIRTSLSAYLYVT